MSYCTIKRKPIFCLALLLIHMSNEEILYRLQIKIKANSIDRKRREDEIITQYKKCEDQIKQIYVSLNALSKRMWAIVNNSHYSQHFFAQLQDIQNITSQQATQEDLINLMSKTSSTFDFLHLYDEKSPFLSSDAFLEILSSLNYLWSEEMATKFCNFFLTLNENQMIQYSQCFLIQPNLQIYFKTALRPIFIQILNNEHDLLPKLLDSLSKFSVLIPIFFIKVLQKSNSKERLFYDLLIKFITHYDLFGIANYEISFYFQQSVNALLGEVETFYQSGKFADFISTKILSPKSIEKNCSFVPKESLLIDTFQHLYKPFILVDELSQPQGNIHIRRLKFLYLPQPVVDSKSDFVKVNEDNYIRSLESSGRPHNVLLTQNLAITLIDRFLSKANLVKIARPSTSSTKRSQQTLDLIRELAELSSVFRDPELESEFDKLSVVLSKCDMSILQIANLYNTKYNRNNDKSKSVDPTELIANYNQQRTFLNKAIEMLDTMNHNAIECGIFRKLLKLEKVLLNNKSGNEYLQNPQDFVDFYLSNAQRLMESRPFQFVFNANWETQINLITPSGIAFQALFLFLVYQTGIYKSNSFPENVIQRNRALAVKFDTDDCKSLINVDPDKSTKPYFDNPEKIRPFIRKLTEIFGNEDPTQLIIPGLILDRLNQATELLIEILKVDGMKEIGMDQLLPIAILGVAYSKPKNLLLFSYFLSNILSVAMMNTTYKPIPGQKESFIVVLYNSVFQVFESLV